MGFASIPAHYHHRHSPHHHFVPPMEEGVGMDRGLPFGFFNKVKNIGITTIDSIEEHDDVAPSTSIKLLKFTACCGGLIALGLLVAGLALNIFGLAILGGVFTLDSGIALFYSYKLGGLKSIDESVAEIRRLNLDRAKREAEFVATEKQYQQNLAQLAKLHKEGQKMVGDLMKGDRADQEQMVKDLAYFRKALERSESENSRLRSQLEKANRYTHQEHHYR